ncbi:Protein of unknown function (DUF4232) [Streptomyces sp. LamerLS-316]|uniref:DUF4232 domain-containing protein n=1 Tax=unclassified Streptomyces TaxID=2593676 RepID=UPI000823CEAD|nr:MULTISPECIES: DUF4232 domain-containing protein [unclassified Streptomyces]MYQ40044.1 DUF4232 domain-containing protein [Streptomyces sp. SID4921]SCK12667.1 Protein of unknown function (DUF4232) [Streptomyces sp. LamerLS-316]
MRTKTLTLAALTLAAGLSLTACQGGEDSAASTTGSGASSSSAGTSADSSASGDSGASDEKTSTGGDDATTTQSAEGSGNGQITTGTCKTENLDFSTTHGMGEGMLTIRLKNTGGDACTLKGFPGVDLRSQDASGPLSAQRSDLDAPVVNLADGETTRFTLHYPQAEGTGAYVSAIEVTPPNETHSKALPVSLRLQIADGADQKVVVDPVGTGKQ